MLGWGLGRAKGCMHAPATCRGRGTRWVGAPASAAERCRSPPTERPTMLPSTPPPPAHAPHLGLCDVVGDALAQRHQARKHVGVAGAQQPRYLRLALGVAQVLVLEHRQDLGGGGGGQGRRQQALILYSAGGVAVARIACGWVRATPGSCAGIGSKATGPAECLGRVHACAIISSCE